MWSKHSVKDGATLKPRNQNPESGTKNRNPETGNRNPQIKENKFFKYAKIVLLSFLTVKSKLPSKKDLKLNLFWNKNSPSVEMVQPLFLVRAMIMRISEKCVLILFQAPWECLK